MPDKTKSWLAAVGTRKYAANFSSIFDSVIRVAKRNKTCDRITHIFSLNAGIPVAVKYRLG